MKPPPRWETAALKRESAQAITLFRRERLVEPLEKWKKTVDECRTMFRALFRSHGLKNPAQLTTKQLSEIFSVGLGDAVRYLAGPPISADDLKVLAESSLSPKKIAGDSEEAARILEIVTQAIDPTRFPWVAEKRAPTRHEEAAAALASAVLIASQRISTERRHEGKNAQERSVKDYLQSLKFTEVAPRVIRTLDDAPKLGQFCSECLVGSRKADIPVRLFDGRLMPIECKVSNSSTNSVKRLNNDAAVKAAIWHKEFGIKQVVPAAVLSGVFKVINLKQAQEGGLALFWSHRLGDIGKFIRATKAG